MKTDLLEEPDDVLADLGETHDDVVGVDVVERGVVAALPARLVQDQVPAVDRRQEVLLLPEGVGGGGKDTIQRCARHSGQCSKVHVYCLVTQRFLILCTKTRTQMAACSLAANAHEWDLEGRQFKHRCRHEKLSTAVGSLSNSTL